MKSLKSLLCLVLLLASIPAFSQVEISPHGVALEIIRHTRGTWGGGQKFSHYSINLKYGKQSKDETVEISIMYSENSIYDTEQTAYQRAKEDYDSYMKEVLFAQSQGKKIIVNSYVGYQYEAILLSDKDDIAVVSPEILAKLEKQIKALKRKKNDNGDYLINKNLIKAFGEMYSDLERSL